jgi:Caspase domain
MSKAVVLLCVALLALSLVAGSALPARAEKRVALLVGNNAYENVPRLQTAINDARAIGAVLRKLGFSVLIAEDQSRRALSETLLAFDKVVDPGDTALFFFAGHGFEIHGQNYLLPTDVPGNAEGREELIRDSSFAAERVIDRLQTRGARAVVLVLDACRNNPFELPGGRGVKVVGGLASMTPVEGVFIMFSAGAKQIALDQLAKSENAQNSVFTRNLMRRLLEPGLTLVQIAKRLQSDVKQMAAAVGHEQTPAYYDQIVGDIVLNQIPGATPPVDDAVPQTVALPSATSKQPPRQDAVPADPRDQVVAELDALAAAENWRELAAGLTAVKPTSRDAHWTALVEQAAVGELTQLTTSPEPFAGRLAAIEHYSSTFPSLRNSQPFRALRASIGLDALGQCFDEARAQPALVECHRRLESFVHAPPVSADLARDAARLIGLKLNRAAAAPLFAIAVQAPAGAPVCADPDLTEAVIPALSDPPDWIETKAGLTLTEACWETINSAVVAQVARETADSYYVHNTCPTLMKHNALTGLRATRCREIMSR